MVRASIIIPLYNKAPYISRAIESVFSQTYQNYEMIVVDDGSTDRGPEIVGQYKDSRLRLVHQANAGPGSARNRGIEVSSAPFLAFLDADDEWMPDFLETSFHALRDHPECDVAASSYYLGAERKDVTGIFRKYGMTEGPWRLAKDISDYELKHAVYILASSSTLSKRSVIEKYGGFYSKNACSYGEDYYLWLEIMLNHNIYRILKPLWWYHLEASGLCGKDPARRDLHPFLTDIDPIRRNCPSEYGRLLDRWLALFALGLAHEYAQAGATARARFLVQQFPLMKRNTLEYWKLRLKMEFPALIPAVRHIKKSLSSGRRLERSRSR